LLPKRSAQDISGVLESFRKLIYMIKERKWWEDNVKDIT
jgi:hypothetical protein